MRCAPFKSRVLKPGDKKTAPATSEQIPVETVMTTNVLTLKPKDSLTEAASLMRQERIGAIPIVEDGVLRGIITRSDILDAFLRING
jgi:CBS domain-containing protein